MTNTVSSHIPCDAANAMFADLLASTPSQPRISLEDRFAQFATAMRQELAPRGLLGHVLAERVILSAWTLQTIAEEELATIRRSPAPGMRPPQGVASALGDLEKSLDLLHLHRAEDSPVWERPAPATSDVTSDFDTETDFVFDPEFDANELADLSNEWPIVSDYPGEEPPTGEYPEAEALGDDEGGLDPRWQDRLVFDPSVSTASPVVKGTWITVSHVLSLIVDGWAWSDILRTHPELTEEDIRTCLAYTVAEEQGRL
jgi:uncharacterized protein (DUF433 family)